MVDGDRFPSKLVLPLDLDGPAFECEIEFTRRAGEIGFILNLPAALGECNLLIDYLRELPGLWLGSKTAGVRLNTDTQIATARRAKVRVEVRRQQDADHVLVDLNGEKIGEWTGDRNSISNNVKEGYPTDRRMSLWIVPGEFVFHGIRVRMLDGGSAATLRPVLTTPSAPAAEQDATQLHE